MHMMRAGAFGAGVARAERVDFATIALFAGALLLVAIPVALTAVPPLGDYPGHLARIFVLDRLLTSHDFDGVFQLSVAPVPNLAMDGVILGFMSLGLSAELAGRAFLILQLWVVALGILSLHAVNFRRISAWPLIAFAFAYNEIFFWGFSNYLLGIGMALLFLAGWLALRERRGKTAMPFFVAATLALYFCHLIAMLFFVALAISLELARLWRRGGEGPASIGMLAFLAVVAALSVAIPVAIWHPPTSATGAGDASAMAAPALFAHISLSEIWWRLHVIVNFAFTYDGRVDALCLGLVLAMLVLAWRAGRLTVRWAYALAVLGLLAVYFLAPTRLWGTDYIAERIPVFIVALVVAAIDMRFVTRRGRAWFATALATLILVRVGLVAEHWRAFDRDYEPLMKAIDSIEPKSRIYAVKAYDKSYTELLRQGWSNLPAYAVIRRGAYYTNIYAAAGQNIVIRTPAYAAAPVPPPHFRAGNGQPSSSAFAAELLAFYDYVFIANPTLWPEPAPASLQPIIVAPEYALYRIPKP